MLRAQGFGVAAVLYDPQETLRAFSDRWGIEFPLLSDVGSVVIQRYGILNREAVGSRVSGIPYPGTFILDPSGRVVDRVFDLQLHELRFAVWSPIGRAIELEPEPVRPHQRLQVVLLAVLIRE